jgi:hypothetical protein
MRKMPIHSENRPVITVARTTPGTPSWSPPNQPIFTLKDYQQLFNNLFITPFNQLTFYYKNNKESEKQETSLPTTSTNPPTHSPPIYNINSPIGTTIIPPPSPTTNPPITFGNVSLPLWLWRELYQSISPFPKPPTQEQEPTTPTLKDLRQLLDHLPITPLPKLPTREQEPTTPKNQVRGPEWIYTQRPTFTPVVFYDSAKGTIYTPPIAFQPTIPQQPPIHHVVLTNLTL